jgi:hypothetical protein
MEVLRRGRDARSCADDPDRGFAEIREFVVDGWGEEGMTIGNQNDETRIPESNQNDE